LPLALNFLADRPPAGRSIARACLIGTRDQTNSHPPRSRTFPRAHRIAILGRSLGSSGIAVVAGHSSTTVVPVLDGRPAWHAAARSGASGALLTDQMQQLLRLRCGASPPAAGRRAC
jgi:actin-related protein